MTKCPNPDIICTGVNQFEVSRKENGRLKCTVCGYLTSDEFTNALFGLEVVNEPKGIAYQNKFDTSLFVSWFCLKKFKTFEARNEHDKKYHKDDDVQLGMFPVGFTPAVEVKCGD